MTNEDIIAHVVHIKQWQDALIRDVNHQSARLTYLLQLLAKNEDKMKIVKTVTKETTTKLDFTMGEIVELIERHVERTTGFKQEKGGRSINIEFDISSSGNPTGCTVTIREKTEKTEE